MTLFTFFTVFNHFFRLFRSLFSFSITFFVFSITLFNHFFRSLFFDHFLLIWIELMTPFLARNDSNQRTPRAHVQSECCARTSAVKSTVLQVYTVPSLSQEHRWGFRRVQVRVRVHTNQQPQVPTSSLVPCAALPQYQQCSASVHILPRKPSHHKINACSNTRHLPQRSRPKRRRTTLSLNLLHWSHHPFRRPVHR